MSYTPSYEKPYPEGFKNEPIETTPITAEVFNGYDDAIENIENYLAEGEMGTVVVANPEIEGTEPNLTALQVGEDKFKIPSGGGSASIDYGDEEAFDGWSESAQNGEIFVRTDEQKYVHIKTPSGIVRIDDKVLISKEEYDALPESKNSDNIPYYIYDWSQSGGSGGYNIDYTEQKTGNKYLGKDIYVCVYPFTRAGVPANGVTLTNSDIPNLLEMENVLDIKYIRDNGSLMVHANGYFSNATTYWISSHFSPSADSTGKLIFEYTKKD